VFTYLHFDHLGTPRLATDDSQTVVWRWDSDAFGATLADEDPDGNGTKVTVNLRFPGQYFDVETGFHYNYYRTYDPGTGRYLESDPIGLGGGLNTYGYVGGNPLRFMDLRGLASEIECFKNPWCIELMHPGVSKATIDQLVKVAVAGASFVVLSEMCKDDLAGKPVKIFNWPLDAGGEEWGRRKGVGATEGRRRAHRIKKRDSMSGSKDNYTVDPATGDVFDPEGEWVGNLNDPG
jgi:RHS repeat-associated protein